MNKYEVRYTVWDIPNLTDIGKQSFTIIIEADEEYVEDIANEYLQEYFATGNYMIDTIVKIE